ncbi:ferritin-like domain-containing protein [Rhodopila sp.]|uniref:ferritin-like domain-containing protein n=1 Tax=Rhodopila sp. TaxID=2480087 RepID=UPI003D152484
MGTRRHLLTRAGWSAAAVGAVASLGFGNAKAASGLDPLLNLGFQPNNPPSGGSDYDILNFALNLEYLEAEFYLRALTGVGLSAADTSGVGTKGTVTGGAAVPFTTAAMAQYAAEIAADEQAHVRFLRAALGGLAVAEPTIDLSRSFTTAAVAAGLIPAGGTFNPFADETSFLLGAYLFEDVGVTAYHGAATLIQSKTYLDAAAGILATEAYHAATVRTLLLQMGQAPATAAISALRAAASGVADDQGVTLGGVTNISLGDGNAIAYDRSTAQVLNIVYLGGASGGYGFFPNGLNGAIA